MDRVVPCEIRREVRHIPKGHRKERARFFRTKNVPIIINAPPATDIARAFRIVDRHWIGERLFSDDILSWNGRLFWPLRWRHTEDRLTEEELLEELAGLDRDPFGQHPQRRIVEPPLPKLSDTAFREIISDPFEAVVAECRRKAASYLLVTGGYAYVSAGEPVFLVHDYGAHSVHAVGADRNAEPHDAWVRSAFYYLGFQDSELRLVQRADRFSDVAKLLKGKYCRRRIPTIEILEDCPGVTANPTEILCDALYRRMVSEARYDERPSRREADVRIRNDRPDEVELRERLFRSAEGFMVDGPDLTQERTTLLREAISLDVLRRKLRDAALDYLAMPDVAKITTPITHDDDAAISLFGANGPFGSSSAGEHW